MTGPGAGYPDSLPEVLIREYSLHQVPDEEENDVDQRVYEALRDEGFDVTLERYVPHIAVEISQRNAPRPLGEEVPVLSGHTLVHLPLKSIPELFVGSAQPDDFSDGPTPEYVMFFSVIELTAMEYCTVTGRREPDFEFERLYRHLRRRPAGQDSNPLFSYLQAAARLYMSLREVSQAEFEAVANRLSKSARHMSQGDVSTNYLYLLESSFDRAK